MSDRPRDVPFERCSVMGLLGVGAAALLLSAGLGSIILLVAVLGLGVPLAIAVVWSMVLARSRALTAKAALLERSEVVRGPLGLTYLVRGSVDGRPVRVSLGRVVIEVVAPYRLDVSLDALVELSRGDHLPEHPFASERARVASEQLVRAGAQRVVIGDRDVTVHGGDDVAALARAATTLALAPALVRFAARAPAGSGCPYCHGAIESVRVAPAIRCDGCDTRQHAECWREHGGCAVFRCKRAPTSTPDERAARASPPTRRSAE